MHFIPMLAISLFVYMSNQRVQKLGETGEWRR